MTSGPVEIRRLTPADWQVLRTLRLAALADSPGSFGSSLGEEQQYDGADWREWIRDAAVFVASRDTEPVGLTAGVDGAEPGERKLIAMWVDPSHRHTGVGSALVSAVQRWAADDGATRLILWVTRENEHARHLYLRRRFVPSGAVRALPSDHDIVEDQLVLDLDGGGHGSGWTTSPSAMWSAP